MTSRAIAPLGGSPHACTRRYEQKPEGLQRRAREDVTGFIQDLVGTLAVYVNQQCIAPNALPSWLAGMHHLDQHATLTPEN